MKKKIANHIPDKGLECEIYKSSQNSAVKTQTIQLEHGQNQ